MFTVRFREGARYLEKSIKECHISRVSLDDWIRLMLLSDGALSSVRLVGDFEDMLDMAG
ncbi:hypothetical protein DPMN_160186 [Dreissena polymorpha]|uniref:Uncharacterized protein n=1 Tax=Dreissena polymorpha TaxID=45954 RepID=A0A9D4EMA9_DREPO|nr:hypothetical protein DPMN_160186 [Dreissena polymorpha]